MENVKELRKSYDAYNAFASGYKKSGASVELVDIEEFGGKCFAMTSSLKLTPGIQRLDVIDVTDYKNVARFSGSWPEPPNPNQKVIVIFPDEGNPAILMEDGTLVWVMFSEIAVRVVAETHN